jgi:hypothetical protein
MSGVDILVEINKFKLRKTVARNNYQDLVQERVSAKAKNTKLLLGMDSTASEEDIVAANLSSTFYFLLDKFKGKSATRLPVAAPCKRGTSYWHRVARLCIEANIDHTMFLKAQFHYFRKAFGRPPEFSQLVTASALARAIEYINKVGKVSSSYVAPVARPVEIAIADKLKIADKRMRSICRTQGMSRAEVYKNLVVPGFLLLPKEYTDADPEYDKALNG